MRAIPFEQLIDTARTHALAGDELHRHCFGRAPAPSARLPPALRATRSRTLVEGAPPRRSRHQSMPVPERSACGIPSSCRAGRPAGQQIHLSMRAPDRRAGEPGFRPPEARLSPPPPSLPLDDPSHGASAHVMTSQRHPLQVVMALLFCFSPSTNHLLCDRVHRVRHVNFTFAAMCF